MNGTLTISKGSDDTIRIELTDSLSRTRCASIKMDPTEFANVIFGLAERPCTFELRSDKVGLRRETKTENVSYVPMWPEVHNNAAAQAAIAEFEKDGWKGNLSDALNHHKRGPDGSYRVTFERWVPVEDAP
jgi:hypothetical protein